MAYVHNHALQTSLGGCHVSNMIKPFEENDKNVFFAAI